MSATAATTVDAMRLLFSHLGIVVEAAGAAGIAALIAHRDRFEGRRVATVLCGGNLTAEQIREYRLADK